MQLTQIFSNLANGGNNTSVRVPIDKIFSRGIVAGDSPSGGATVPNQVRDVTDMLRPINVAVAAGAQVYVVSGDQQLPLVKSGATAHWVSETGTAPESALEFGATHATPRRLSVNLAPVSRQLLQQSGGYAESAIRKNIHGAISQGLLTAIFQGLGGIEPIGLSFNDDIPAPVTYGGAAAFLDLCEHEETLGNAYAENASTAFIVSTGTRKKWRQTDSLAGSGKSLWEAAKEIGNGKIFATPTIADDKSFFGSWNELAIFMWGDVQLIADPYARKKTHEVEFVANLHADVAPLRFSAFTKSTDSAAQ